MRSKVRIEIDRESEEEIVIRCHELTPEIERIRKALETGRAGPPDDMLLTLCGTDYIIPTDKLLFFESAGERTAAHTAGRMYYTDKTLSELTEELGSGFFRISKSCIANMKCISSLKRELNGVCEARFYGSEKTVYISRMYYKAFRDRLEELRCGKIGK